MSPVKFRHEIEAEQKCHPGKCIYHLSKTHATTSCFVKKECDKLQAEKKESGSSSVTTGSGSLRHLTEEAFEDAVMDDSVIDSIDIASNDTSNDICGLFFSYV